MRSYRGECHQKIAEHHFVDRQRSRVPRCGLHRMLPSSLWEKSPCEVSESVIRRLQNTISWTDSEAECPDAVCLACSHRHCGESPRVKFQRVSSEDRRTPVRGQTVKQNAEIRSAFYATAQMLIFHIFNSVHPFSCRGHGVRDSRNLGKIVVRLFVSSSSVSHVSGCRNDHWCRV